MRYLISSRPCAAAVLVAALASAAMATVTGAGRKFYDDDPLSREPETQDASGATPREIDLVWDLALNLFARPGDKTPNVRAQNINTIDEVPDSGWFTNRILARPLSSEEAARGPLTGSGPAPGKLIVVGPKTSGAAPGFRAQDERGDLWFVSLDAKGYPEAATSAILVAEKLFWALGYWQVENYLTTVRPDQVVVADTATIRVPSGRQRPMRMSDLDRVFERSHRSADGSYRAVAAKAVPGKVLEGFEYYGTRPDDPNDLVPHEHRRELRALKVFGAWTNLVDMKAGNTLDSVVQENGRGVVRHYLQDIGSTFGTGANAPREWDEGWEFLYEGDKMLKRLVTFGFYIQPWQTVPYEYHHAIGRFEGDEFDPPGWRPRVPTAAFLRARADDNFWAARRVKAFSDEMIRAIVRTGNYSDPAAEAHLANVLIKRRDKIAQSYLPAVNPLVDFALDEGGMLSFANAAVATGVAPAPRGGYRAMWASFDNLTGETREIGAATAGAGERLQAPSGLPSTPGSFIKVQVTAVDPPNPSWTVPVDVYFRRLDSRWKLVGLERQQ